MTKGLVRSLSRAPSQAAKIIKVRVPVKNVGVNVTDVPAAAGWGSVVLGGLPQGNLLFLGAVAYLSFASSSGTIVATFSGNFALGTTPTADNTLSGTDVNLVPSTALGPAVAGATSTMRGVSTGTESGAVLDNTDGSLEVNLNMTIADASISGNAFFAVNGYVMLSLIVLSDD